MGESYVQLSSLLCRIASERRDVLAFSFEHEGGEPEHLSYGALHDRARVIARQILRSAAPGDVVLIVLPQSLDYLAAFWACQYAGVIAAPIHPPKRSRGNPRLEAVTKDSGARLALTDATIAGMLANRATAPLLDELRWLDVTSIDEESRVAELPPAGDDPDAIAFLQYTSGSTGTPRGVMVTHGNLFANLEVLDRGFQHSRESVMVSWLPFFHDMGLIYGTLLPIFKGIPCHLLTPAAVMQKPVRWLEAITRHQATHSGAPNFAYELCARAISEEQRAGLDLRSWKMALNGAEPIRDETLRNFADAFGSCGFEPDAFCPGYGLAEATLKVCAVRADEAPTTRMVSESALAQHRLIPVGQEEHGRNGQASKTLVACGRPEPSTRVEIVHPITCEILPPNTIGEIWVASDSVAKGYWRRPEETKAVFGGFLASCGSGPFLRTGDLGVFDDGALLVTGRIKDVLIFRGLNHYPQDLERSAALSHEALAEDGAAAFAVEIEGTSRLVIAVELTRRGMKLVKRDEDVIGAIREAIAGAHDLACHAIVLLRPKSLPKTTSGKVQRSACRAAFLDGGLKVIDQWTRPDAGAPMVENTLPDDAEVHPKLISDWLAARVALTLAIAPEKIDRTLPFVRHGLGSAESVRLSAALGEWLGRRVGPTALYDYPTIAQLADHLGRVARPPARKKRRQQRRTDPIAVVGIGCRMPKADGVEAFWSLLEDGGDGVTEVPINRWDAEAFYDASGEQPGRMRTRAGGFLDHVDRFDPGFFGISPHEARRMDPQQRLLLEVSWEALEHAGIAADTLAGTETGVFVGISGNDYARFQTRDIAFMDDRSGTGNALIVAANRISYSLDLRGPSLAVDTACSSSLVAVHTACQSLRSGESDLALVGGVNLILTPHWSVAFSRAGMLAADGRCKTFDASADGYGRGEGCGVVVLRRLRDARRDGDRVLAVIRGSAVNQDGRSNGLTAPSRLAQEEVIERAWHDAGLTPNDIDAIEAHGTGTPLGDPIEVHALTSVLARIEDEEPRGARRCALGSVKTNIGHLESAAGIAGLIKSTLALDRELLPPHLHLERMNEQIDLSDSPLFVPTRPTPWPRTERPRRIGVSSFGFGGTNAHVVLEEAPVVASAEPAARPDRQWHVVPLFAKSESALDDLAARWAERLAEPDQDKVADLAASAIAGRAHLPYRAVVVADERDRLRQGIEVIRRSDGAGVPRRGVVRARALPQADDAGPVFLFSGQGSLTGSLDPSLFDRHPAFGSTLERCDRLVRDAEGFSVLDALFGREPDLDVKETRFGQPCLFALQASLFAQWRAWGVEPAAVLGHSVGEYTAAFAAGALSLEDGLALLAARGRLMQDAPGAGAMIMVLADVESISARLPAFDDRLVIAAVNGPEQIVVSGEAEAVVELSAALEAEGTTCIDLEAGHGFHSSLMAPVVEPFGAVLDGVTFAPTTLPLVSNACGECLAPGTMVDSDHWLRHLMAPVQYAAGIETLANAGHRLFVELGGSGALSTLGRRVLDADAAAFVPCLLPGRDSERTMVEAVSTLFVHGFAIDWKAFDEGLNRCRVRLPTYPFQHASYWFEPPLAADAPQEGTMKVNEVSTVSDSSAADSSVSVPAHGALTSGALTSGASTSGASTNGAASVLDDLRSTLSRMLDVDPAALDPHVPFLELGADSIVLVGVIRAVEQRYGIDLPVRQLFEEVTTLARLAEHIAVHAPRGLDVPASPDTVSPVTPAPEQPALSTTAQPAALQRVIDGQLEIMRQQLALLGGTAAGAPTSLDTAQSRLVIEAPAGAAGTGNRGPAFGASRTMNDSRALTSAQQSYISGLSTRLDARSGSSKRYIAKHRDRWADLRMAMNLRAETKELTYPIVGDRSEGAHVFDHDGNRFVDLSMGFGVNLFGHNPSFVMDAVRAQLDRGIHVGIQSDLAGDVAASICRLTGNDRVTFANSGTEAVMTAIRMARAATGRTLIAHFSGAYHGHADPTLAVADLEHDAAPMAAGVPWATAQQSLVLPYGEDRALEAIEARAGELAAVLVEPVQSRRPGLQPQAFLEQLRDLTRRHGIALMFDEVITGFRSHPGGVQHLFGIEADLVTYGKVLGGGMPIGVVAGQRAFLDTIDGGTWAYGDDSLPSTPMTFAAGTFCKHPLAMAATRAVLDHLEQAGPALQVALSERTAEAVARFQAALDAHEVPIKVEHFASMFRFAHAGNDSYVFQPIEMDLFYSGLIEQGVYVWEGRTCFLSTVHTEADISKIEAAIAASAVGLRSAGFWTEDESHVAATASVPVPASSDAASSDAASSDAKDRHPLTEAQRQLWLLSQMNEGGALAYTVSVAAELRGTLDRAALEGSLDGTVARHEALRTTIDSDGNHQRIAQSSAVSLESVDLRDAEGPDTALEEHLLRDAERPFPLDGAPLLRAALYQLAEDHHVLGLAAHHLIVDGWSMGLILEDVLQGYRADVEAAPAPAAPSYRWRDFLQTERAQQSEPRMDGHEAFWREQLDGAREDLALPADHPRPATKSFRGARLTADVDGGDLEALRVLGTARGATLLMTLFAAWSAYLERVTGQGDLTIGIPASGRPTGADAAIGYFAHLLPIRVHAGGEGSFDDHLRSVRGRLLDAYEHQALPFARLIASLEREHNPSHTPLLATTFNLERSMRLPQIAGLDVRLVTRPIRYTGFDVHLNVLDHDDRLAIELDFTTDLFTAATAQHLLDGFMTALSAVARTPDVTLASLPILPAEMRKRLLVTFNDTDRPVDAFASIHDAIASHASVRPDADAIVLGDRRVRYRELDHRANQVAHLLVADGVQVGEMVGLWSTRSVDTVVAMLGILKAGAAYVPLDPGLPQGRLRYVIGDAGLLRIVSGDGTSTTSLPAEMLNKRARLIDLVAHADELDAQPTVDPERGVGWTHAAYTIYTSGSTGKPKGVVVSHGPVCHLVCGQRSLFEVRPESRVLQFANLGFDASVSEIFVTLAAGASLHLASQEDLTPGPPLVDLLRRDGISLVTLPPSVLAALSADDLPALETVVSAGEACTSEIVDRWAGAVRLVNAYGPTEGCVCATGGVCSRGETPSIGGPIDNVRVYVLNHQGQPAPIGAVGEICIGGAQLAMGYLHQPAMTAAAFVPDPFGEDAPGGRLYRTGDRGRLRADGTIDFLGRRDHQVKLRGYRIELAEIERTLTDQSAVREAVVVLRDGHLVAYVVPSEDGLALNALRDQLADALPAYMVPTDLVRLETLPLTHNGKVDRDALPAPDRHRQSQRAAYVAPRNPIESELADIWRDVLDVDPIGIHDDFITLGGHSLLSIQIATRVEASFGVRLSLKDLFTGQTLESLAQQIESALLGDITPEALESALQEMQVEGDVAVESGS